MIDPAPGLVGGRRRSKVVGVWVLLGGLVMGMGVASVATVVIGSPATSSPSAPEQPGGGVFAQTTVLLPAPEAGRFPWALPCRTSFPQPSYKPSLVTGEAANCTAQSRQVIYTLDGPSNALSVPTGVQPRDWPIDGSVHPGAYVFFTAVDGFQAMPLPMGGITHTESRTVTLRNGVGRVTVPKNGYGDLPGRVALTRHPVHRDDDARTHQHRHKRRDTG